MNSYNNQGFLHSFNFYVVTQLYVNRLNPLTQPQKLKERHVFKDVRIFLFLIVVEVMNKQRMVIMNKIYMSNLFELGMEKLEDDKVVNPHCLFLLISTVVIHIILM
jgi:hypothetical protein